VGYIPRKRGAVADSPNISQLTLSFQVRQLLTIST
jgi:hypothetical protein